MAQNYASWGWTGSNYAERIFVEIWHSSTNIAGNYSTFGYNIWNNSHNSFGNTGSISWRIQDPWSSSRASGTRGETETTAKYQTKDYASGTFTINHNADGTLPNTYFELFISRTRGNTQSAVVGVTVSDIPRIPRASSFTAPSSYGMGGLIAIDIQRATSAFTHVVNVHYGSHLIFSGGGFTTSASFGVDHAWLYNLTPNEASVTLVITVGTYQGSTWIGGTSKNITAVNNLRPNFSSISHVEAVSGLAAKFGAYIQSKSRVTIGIVGATASTGASITGYRLSVDNQVLGAASGTTQPISSKGTVVITGIVTDSRGFTATKTANINVLEYVPPSITAFNIYRSDSSGVPNDYGTHAKFEFNYKVTPLGNKNGVITKVKVGSNNVNVSQTTYTGKYIVQYAGFDVNLPYPVELIIADYFGETISPQTLVPGATALVLGRDWASVGQFDNKGPGTFSVAKKIFSEGLMVAALGGTIVEYDE